MEAMTIEMHSIAKKTERETVSMRAITSVTLFFLPATFLAVSFSSIRHYYGFISSHVMLTPLQSFMSTDIIDFKDGKNDLQLTGLKLYLAIALPATFFTFVAWYFISWLAKGNSETVDNEQPGSDIV
jgi:hypothetical protein